MYKIGDKVPECNVINVLKQGYTTKHSYLLYHYDGDKFICNDTTNNDSWNSRIEHNLKGHIISSLPQNINDIKYDI